VGTNKDKKHYNQLVRALDELIDEIGENEKHPLFRLMETIGSLIEIYEYENIPPVKGNPVEIIKMLMIEHNLTQKDLSELGSQGVVSEILNGKRILNTRQIKLLSERFNVSPIVFI
jgi:HTH-type transcriptional regulator/antitoxin HigA